MRSPVEMGERYFDALFFYKKEGVRGYKALHFNGGYTGSPVSAERGRTASECAYSGHVFSRGRKQEDFIQDVESLPGLFRAWLEFRSGRRDGPPRVHALGEDNRPRRRGGLLFRGEGVTPLYRGSSASEGSLLLFFRWRGRPTPSKTTLLTQRDFE